MFFFHTGTIFGFLFLCFLAYLEYRRRVKKAAMERYKPRNLPPPFFIFTLLDLFHSPCVLYLNCINCETIIVYCRYAMKRMRRKFKAMQRDINGRSVDWRTLYLESKQNEEAGLKDKKKKKKTRDKNAEKRDKERKKR